MASRTISTKFCPGRSDRVAKGSTFAGDLQQGKVGLGEFGIVFKGGGVAVGVMNQLGEANPCDPLAHLDPEGVHAERSV